MKIKRKVEMNLPQLIEWAWDNPKRHEIRAFIDDTREFGSEIYVQEHNGFISIQGEFNKDDTFTVEVEEEITEDTELDLIERFIGGMGYSCYTTHRMTIKDCLRRSPEECTTTHFYIENDDRELVLIWRDGKLVE